MRAADTLVDDVAGVLARTRPRAATDWGRRIRRSDLCLKKRSSFPRNLPRKLCFCIVVDAFRVDSRVGTNSFRCTSLLTGRTEVLVGDHLIKLRSHDEESARALCRRMEEAQMRNDARAGPPQTHACIAVGVGRIIGFETKGIDSTTICHFSSTSTHLCRQGSGRCGFGYEGYILINYGYD